MTPDEVLDEAESALRLGDPAGVERALAKLWPDIRQAPADAKHVLGRARVEQQRFGEAEDLLRAAVQAEPQSLRHHVALGHALVAAGKFNDAANAYDSALRIDAAWPGLATAFSSAAYMAGRHQEAERAARHAIETSPNSSAWDALSAALRAQGKAQDAYNAAAEAVRLDDSNINAQNSLGAALMMLGRGQEALDVFDTLVSRGVVSPVLSLNRGTALQMLDRTAEAFAVYDEALQRWPNLPNLQQQIAQRRSGARH